VVATSPSREKRETKRSDEEPWVAYVHISRGTRNAPRYAKNEEVSMKRAAFHIPLLAAVAVASSVTAGCARKHPAQAPTETTSARVPSADFVPKAEAEQLRRERDALREEKARNEQQAARLRAEMQATMEREALTTRGWTAIENAETELKSLRQQAVHAPATRKHELDKKVADISANVTVVRRDLRLVPSASAASWSVVKTKATSAVDALERAVRTAPR
jgi:hypothetical protein